MRSLIPNENKSPPEKLSELIKACTDRLLYLRMLQTFISSDFENLSILKKQLLKRKARGVQE